MGVGHPPCNGGLAMKGKRQVLHVDGKIMTYDKIKAKFKVSFNKISKIIEQHGRDLKSSHFPDRSLPVISAPTEKVFEDRSPGWAERKYFPAAGKNGFHGGKASSSSCVVGHCDLPSLSGD